MFFDDFNVEGGVNPCCPREEGQIRRRLAQSKRSRRGCLIDLNDCTSIFSMFFRSFDAEDVLQLIEAITTLASAIHSYGEQVFDFCSNVPSLCEIIAVLIGDADQQILDAIQNLLNSLGDQKCIRIIGELGDMDILNQLILAERKIRSPTQFLCLFASIFHPFALFSQKSVHCLLENDFLTHILSLITKIHSDTPLQESVLGLLCEISKHSIKTHHYINLLKLMLRLYKIEDLSNIKHLLIRVVTANTNSFQFAQLFTKDNESMDMLKTSIDCTACTLDQIEGLCLLSKLLQLFDGQFIEIDPGFAVLMESHNKKKQLLALEAVLLYSKTGNKAIDSLFFIGIVSILSNVINQQQNLNGCVLAARIACILLYRSTRAQLIELLSIGLIPAITNLLQLGDVSLFEDLITALRRICFTEQITECLDEFFAVGGVQMVEDLAYSEDSRKSTMAKVFLREIIKPK